MSDNNLVGQLVIPAVQFYAPAAAQQHLPVHLHWRATAKLTTWIMSNVSEEISPYELYLHTHRLHESDKATEKIFVANPVAAEMEVLI